MLLRLSASLSLPLSDPRETGDRKVIVMALACLIVGMSNHSLLAGRGLVEPVEDPLLLVRY